MVFFIGCSESPKSRPPDNIIGQEQMTKIIVDMQIVEAVLVKKRGKGIDVGVISQKYYEALFNKYGITKGKFDSSITYYKKDLDGLKDIYENVIIELNKMDRQVEKKAGTTEKK